MKRANNLKRAVGLRDKNFGEIILQAGAEYPDGFMAVLEHAASRKDESFSLNEDQKQQAKFMRAERALVDARGAPPTFENEEELTGEQRNDMFFQKLQDGLISHEEYEQLVTQNNLFMEEEEKVEELEAEAEAETGAEVVGEGAAADVPSGEVPLAARLSGILKSKLSDGSISQEEYDILMIQYR